MISKRSLGLAGMLLSTVPSLFALGRFTVVNESMPPLIRRVEAVSSRLVSLVSDNDPAPERIAEIEDLLKERARLTSSPSYAASVESYQREVDVARQRGWYATSVGLTLLLGSYHLLKQVRREEERQRTPAEAHSY